MLFLFLLTWKLLISVTPVNSDHSLSTGVEYYLYVLYVSNIIIDNNHKSSRSVIIYIVATGEYRGFGRVEISC